MKVDIIHTIHNSNGISVKILNFGGIIYEINTPDRNNNLKNIVLNYKFYLKINKLHVSCVRNIRLLETCKI